jgi:DNA repair protein RecN (Recombination protein N)
MLSRLSVRNFALIDSVDLQLNEGLTVLTGETGAGKSILFNAVELLMGERASTELIRSSAESAVVQGVIVPSDDLHETIAEILEEAGIPFDGELIVRRRISRNGRNRAWLNDQIVTTSLIADLVPRCVDILGQHQHLSLLEPYRQQRLIDESGVPSHVLDEMSDAYREWNAARKELRTLKEAADERHERMEFIRFQLQELSELELEEGEFEELDKKVAALRHSEKLRRAGEGASNWLVDGDRSASEAIGEAKAQLMSVAQYEDRVDGWIERLEEAIALVDDVSHEVALLLDDAPNVSEIDEIMARHEQLRRAMKRFGEDEAGLLSKIDELSEELQTLESYEDSLARAEQKVVDTREKAVAAADTLAEERKKHAAALFEEVESVLATLGMEHADLRWDSTDEERKIRSDGWSGMGLFFSANPGEEPRPIEKVASGGELSRLLLALKSAMLERDPVDTYLFDEIDTGIGGQAAVVVGRLLRSIGEHRQVLCITHLPQIAGKAHHQLLVEKQVHEQRTTTHIRVLRTAERESEIARMLGGEAAGDTTKAHARELLGLLH